MSVDKVSHAGRTANFWYGRYFWALWQARIHDGRTNTNSELSANAWNTPHQHASYMTSYPRMSRPYVKSHTWTTAIRTTEAS